MAPDSSRYLKVVVLSLCGHTNADTATGQNTKGGGEGGGGALWNVSHGGWGGGRWEDSLKRICFGVFYFGRALGAAGCWSRFLAAAAWVKKVNRLTLREGALPFKKCRGATLSCGDERPEALGYSFRAIVQIQRTVHEPSGKRRAIRTHTGGGAGNEKSP